MFSGSLSLEALVARSQHPMVELEAAPSTGILVANEAFRSLATRLADGAAQYEMARKVLAEEEEEEDPFVRAGLLLVVIGRRRAPLLLRRLGGEVFEVEASCLAHYRHVERKTVDGSWLWFPKHDVEHMDARFWHCLNIEELPDHVPASWMSRLRVHDSNSARRTFERHAESCGAEPYFCVVRYETEREKTIVFCRGEGQLWDVDGQPLVMAGLHMDITALHRQATLDLVRVSHETKTPLSALAGALELLEPRDAEGEEEDMWAVCRTSLAELTVAISDNIRLAQMSVGEFPPEALEPANLRDLIRDIVRLTRGRLVSRSQPLDVVGPDRDAVALASAFHVRTVLVAVIRRVSSSLAAETPLRLTWDHADDLLLLVVGPRDDSTRLASRRWRSVSDLRNHATNLALLGPPAEQVDDRLATCAALCRQLGGSLSSVPDAPDLRICIPTRPLDDRRRGSPRGGGGGGHELADPILLIVDDIKLNRVIATRQLRKLGFADITEAASGRAAIDLLNSHKFDLLILDMHLPDLNGDLVIAQTDFPRDRIFLWSAAGDVKALRDLADHLDVGVLDKPFSEANKATLLAFIPPA